MIRSDETGADSVERQCNSIHQYLHGKVASRGEMRQVEVGASGEVLWIGELGCSGSAVMRAPQCAVIGVYSPFLWLDKLEIRNW